MNATSQKLAEMRGVKLQLANKTILDGVDFSLYAEEVLVIMGLSGAGKSTLLSILMGLIKPDAGSIFIRGTDEDLTKVADSRLNDLRTHVGMVFQSGALISSMNMRDNVALPLRELTDKADDEIDSIVDQKLELVGLKDAKQKLPSELSGGMKKRAGLARALALEPDVVLFDEPTAGLDPIHAETIDDLIIELREKHKVASIVVTHEMDSAFAVATRMAFLHEGKIICEGSPEEFRHSSIPFVSKFLASYSKHECAKE